MHNWATKNISLAQRRRRSNGYRIEVILRNRSPIYECRVVCLEWYSETTDDFILRGHKWYYCVAKGMGENDYQYGPRIVKCLW